MYSSSLINYKFKIKMKGVILLINEPPNNRRIVFKYTVNSLNNQMPNAPKSECESKLEELYKKYTFL